MKSIFSILSLSLLLVGCSTSNPAGARPSPSTSEFLHTKGGGFTVQMDANRKPVSCRYSLLVTPTKRVIAPLYLHARFENPAGGAPLTADAVLQPNASDLLLTSPPVRGVRSGKTYRVDVLIYSDAAKTQEISRHTQAVQSSMNL